LLFEIYDDEMIFNKIIVHTAFDAV